MLVIIIPSILALTSLATSLALVGELRVLGEAHQFSDPPRWFTPIGVLSFSLSLVVNAIFTGLLVFKIAKASLASNSHGKNSLRPLLSMLIESGVILFVVQLMWVIFFSTANTGFYVFGGPITMVYGIMPTIIVVRVSMRDTNTQQSVESTMRFAVADENSPTKISGSLFQWNSRRSDILYSEDSKETED